MKKVMTYLGIIASSLAAVALFLQNIEKIFDSTGTMADRFGVSRPSHCNWSANIKYRSMSGGRPGLVLSGSIELAMTFR